MKPSGLYFEVVTFTSDGVPAPWGDLNNFMVLDMEFMPAFVHRPMMVTGGYGTVRLPAADKPFALCVPLKVDGFGHNYVYADNEGRGYSAKEVSGKKLNFCLEAAKSRLSAVKRSEKRYRKYAFKPSSSYSGRVAKAEKKIR